MEPAVGYLLHTCSPYPTCTDIWPSRLPSQSLGCLWEPTLLLPPRAMTEPHEMGQRTQDLPTLITHPACGGQERANLDSISRLAASAYLKSRRLASSRNLIRDNLGQGAGGCEAFYKGLATHTQPPPPTGVGPSCGPVPDGNVIHDFTKHGR